MKIAILFLLLNCLYGLPRFSLEQGSQCISCHINPTGGGMRNDYGSNVYTLDELTIRKWISKGNEDWDGYVTDNVQLGGEFRLQSFDGNSGSSTFPMQMELYANIDINEDVDLYVELPAGQSGLADNYDFFLLFNNLPNNTWVKIGKASPNYGLMIDDHSSFIKSGNGDKATLFDDNNIDSGFRNMFDPTRSKPIMIESGFNFGKGFSMTIDASQSLKDYPQDKLVNYASTLTYMKSFDNISFMLGTSLMHENDVNLRGFFGGFSVSKFSITFEIDRADNLFDIPGYRSSLASYAQFVYKPIQGLHLIAKYDFFDYNETVENGALSRFSYGFEFYPLNMLEFKFQIREYSSNYWELADPISNMNHYSSSESNINKPEYLLQLHAWF